LFCNYLKNLIILQQTIQIQYFKTPIGELILGSYQDKLCLADWRYRKMRTAIDNRIIRGLSAEFEEFESPIIKETKNQLIAYFERKRRAFDIPLLFVGSEFQKNVWNELLQIPYGKTMTYLDLSKKINNEKAIRAVASANGANAISIIVPCHRIIGSDGKLIGYAGGLKAKSQLLSIENVRLSMQIDLFGNAEIL
jgi:methylated-DNA-[protein]-cysteine S-methyltransferase